MEINLKQEMEDQLDRLRRLADDAVDDEDESYSSRAAALSALSKLLHQMTAEMERVYNMERLQKVEQAIIEVFEEVGSEDQKALFISKLRELQTGNTENTEDFEQKMMEMEQKEVENDIVVLDPDEFPEDFVDI